MPLMLKCIADVKLEPEPPVRGRLRAPHAAERVVR